MGGIVNQIGSRSKIIDGNVGINTADPDQLLHIYQASSGSGNAGSGQLVLENSTTAAIQFLCPAGNASQINFGDPGGNEIGQIVYHHSGDYMKFHTASTERMRITSNGEIQLGQPGTTAYPASKVICQTSDTSMGCLTVRHDSGAVCHMMSMIGGTNTGSGTNVCISFMDGDGTAQGQISFTSGTVTYGTFTANHDAKLPDADNEDGYAYGTLVETTEIYYKQKDGEDVERGILYKVQKSSSANSKLVLGTYAGRYTQEDPFTNDGELQHENLHQIYILGDGHILSNNEGGNIEVGDGICTSSTDGIGMKATANPSMIIGLAQEDVTFSGSETKLVPVQFGLRQFTPWT
mgnify:CR=1 FL=1